MTTQDDFDADIDAIDPADDGVQAEAPERKTRGGLFFMLATVAVVAGGGYAAVKTLGIQVPFLNPAAPVAASDIAPPPSTPLAGSAQNDPIIWDGAPVDPAVTSAATAEDQLAGDPAAASPPADGAGLGAMPQAIAPPSAAEDVLAAGATDAATPADNNDDTFAASAPADQLAAETAAADAAVTPVTDPAAVTTADPAAVPASDALVAAETPAPVTTPADNDIPPDPFVTAPAAEQTPPAMPETAATAVAAPVAPETAQRLQEVEQKLFAMESEQVTRADFDALRQDILKLQAAIASGKATAAAAAPVAEKPVASYQSEVEAAPAVPASKIRTAKKPARTKSTAKSTAKAPVATGWVLKSAKPGTAWVAQKGSSELKTVSVGDTLSGIGKITSINQNAAGRWVVNGSKGQINQ